MLEFDDTHYTGNKFFNWQKETGCEGQMEVFQPFVDQVLAANAVNPKKVWTVLDSETSDDMLIVAGYHYVNRVLYFISNEEWKAESEQYYWCKFSEDE